MWHKRYGSSLKEMGLFGETIKENQPPYLSCMFEGIAYIQYVKTFGRSLKSTVNIRAAGHGFSKSDNVGNH